MGKYKRYKNSIEKFLSGDSGKTIFQLCIQYWRRDRHLGRTFQNPAPTGRKRHAFDRYGCGSSNVYTHGFRPSGQRISLGRSISRTGIERSGRPSRLQKRRRYRHQRKHGREKRYCRIGCGSPAHRRHSLEYRGERGETRKISRTAYRNSRLPPTRFPVWPSLPMLHRNISTKWLPYRNR